ncbi:hypothetical protein [Nocardia sp. NPDC004604]|uniref:hypothetical protein n=1 Tax=Nocardia sp. NPDC004604 TaxID=3157013 RepID=UPI0033A1C12B
MLLDILRAELIAEPATVDLTSWWLGARVSTGGVCHHFGSKVSLLAAAYSAFYGARRRSGIWSQRRWNSLHLDPGVARGWKERIRVKTVVKEAEAEGGRRMRRSGRGWLRVLPE